MPVNYIEAYYFQSIENQKQGENESEETLGEVYANTLCTVFTAVLLFFLFLFFFSAFREYLFFCGRGVHVWECM